MDGLDADYFEGWACEEAVDVGVELVKSRFFGEVWAKWLKGMVGLVRC